MPLLLLLGTGIVAIGTDVFLARRAWVDQNLVPRIGQFDARKIGIGIGLAGLLVGGPVLGTLGAGVAIGTILGSMNLSMFNDAIVAYRTAQAKQLPGNAANELPADPPPADPAAADKANGWGGLLAT